MTRVATSVIIAIVLFVPTPRAEANVGWVVSYLLGKAADTIWDGVTGKPDVRKLDRRLQALEQNVARHDQEIAGQIKRLRSQVSVNTTRADFDQLVQNTLERIARVEARVDRNEQDIRKNRGDIHTNRSEIDSLRRRVAQLEAQAASSPVAPAIVSNASRSASRDSSAASTLSSFHGRQATLTMTERKLPHQTQASQRFGNALSLYWNRRYTEASQELAIVQTLDSVQPVYCYFQALTERHLGNHAAAQKALDRAVSLERTNPIPNWGVTMQRVQGQSRLWIEDARYDVSGSRISSPQPLVQRR